MRYLRLIALLCGLFAFGAAAAAEPLPRLGADAARVSVSGLSSGGYMAVQYEVAFSAQTIGAGVVAGGPYGCAGIYLALFLSVCMKGKPAGSTSWASVQDFAQAGLIDPPVGLAAHRVYLFSGRKDSIVAQTVMNGLRDFYRAARVPRRNLAYVNRVPAGHAFISVHTGDADCGANHDTYIDRCTVKGQPYDQPGAILSHLYGPLQPAVAQRSAPLPFDQAPFATPAAKMAATGFVYVPQACRGGGLPCAVHVVFHGCSQSAKFVGDEVWGKLGYNEWAESNGIVILYPQVDDSFANPKGCWDWWGYTGTGFLFRSGAQLSAVHAMVTQLLARP